MIDILDTLLRQLNIAKENNATIVVLAEDKDISLEIEMIPDVIIYDINGLEILDENCYHFKINNPDDFDLIKDDEWGVNHYVFRDMENKRYYGIKI